MRFLLWLLVSGCTTAQVWPVGPSVQAAQKDEWCDVEVEPGIPITPRRDLAWVRLRCRTPLLASTLCMDRLLERTCAMGGDLVYSIAEEVDGDPRGSRRIIRAIIAKRVDPLALGLAPKKLGRQETSTSTVACNPTCESGYACFAGACAARCVPACERGFVCEEDRVCRAGL